MYSYKINFTKLITIFIVLTLDNSRANDGKYNLTYKLEIQQ